MEPLHAAGSAEDLQRPESSAGRGDGAARRPGLNGEVNRTRHPTLVFDQSPILQASRLLRAVALNDGDDDGAGLELHPGSGSGSSSVPVPAAALSMIPDGDPGPGI
ncbi:hypothetical protein H4R19_006839, partial [Coemansia spiralis]